MHTFCFISKRSDFERISKYWKIRNFWKKHDFDKGIALMQKRCARLILDAKFSDNFVKLFTKLGWLPIDDIIRSRKLDLLHKISFGHCPDYFIPYIHYLKDTHSYNTKATTKYNLVIPKCKRVSGCRTFHTSATRLWNNVDVSIRDTTLHKQFTAKVRQKLLKQNATLEHFVISSTF